VILLPTVDKTYTVECGLLNPHVDSSPTLVLCNLMHVSDITCVPYIHQCPSASIAPEIYGKLIVTFLMLIVTFLTIYHFEIRI